MRDFLGYIRLVVPVIHIFDDYKYNHVYTKYVNHKNTSNRAIKSQLCCAHCIMYLCVQAYNNTTICNLN